MKFLIHGLDADTIKELANDLKIKIEAENHEAWLFFIVNIIQK